MKRLWVPLVLLLLAACSQVTPGPSSTELGPLTFGTSAYDYGYKLAKHSAGVYVVGATEGTLHTTQQGGSDAFIRKYDTGGGVTWGRQLGTPQNDYANGVASDSSNNAYVAGTTSGSLAGSRGASDFFLRKYSASGSVAWTRQFGTSGSETASDVAVSGSNIYVAGSVFNFTTNDTNANLTKFNTSGTQLWTRTFGSSLTDVARDVATDSSGNAYVVGFTDGVLTGTRGDGRDMFVRKYNTSGGVVWTKQFNYSFDDSAEAVAVNGTSVFVVGYASSDAGSSSNADVRLIKLTTSGSLGFSRSYGSSLNQYGADVSVVNGAVFVSGYEINANDFGGFVSKYNGSGVIQWRAEQDSSGTDFSAGVLARSASEVYITGETDGVLGSGNSGNRDAFLRRLNGSTGSTVWTDQ